MAFRFHILCDLLSTLEDAATRDPPYLSDELRRKSWQVTRDWFRAHRRAVDGLDAAGLEALLSTLLPERRTDRVYGLQATTLSRLLSRALGLSTSKARDLNAFRRTGGGDLGQCLERALQGGGPPGLPVVTVEEIDAVLAALASTCRFSDPTVRGQAERTLPVGPTTSLANVFRRLLPNEAKWLVRLVLKDFAPVRLDEQLLLRSIHFLLSDILHFQNGFGVAVMTLKSSFKTYPVCPDQQSEPLLRRLASSALRPVVGIKVARPAFCKARSIEHCLGIIGKNRWMVERKYDGEYCEIHVDLTRGDDWLKIFSKSAKDSTADRIALKDVLRGCLGIGTPRCKIQSRCILLGEMVVWCDLTQSILPFHSIRKHVTRSGRSLGTRSDSPPHAHEHLMIVFYDLLVLDDVMMLNKPIEQRKAALNGLYRKKQGRAVTAESKVIDFAEADSKRKLIAHLASSIARRHEGLVLKPCGRSYFSFARDDDACEVIKLKKDYIKGLGDEADLAVIGASYRAQDALRLGLPERDFTHFHLGCLTNKEDVQRFDARPIFKLVGTVSCDQGIPRPILERVNRHASLTSERLDGGRTATGYDLDSSGLATRMDVALRDPCVFEVLGSSYVKPPDATFWMLRHPRVQRMHEDRTWLECKTFDELQDLAKAAVDCPAEAESQENLLWLDRVERSCRRKMARRLASISPRSDHSTMPAETSTPARSSGSRGMPVGPDGMRTLRLISPNAERGAPGIATPFEERVMDLGSSEIASVSKVRAIVDLALSEDDRRHLLTPPASSPCLIGQSATWAKRAATDSVETPVKRRRLQEPGSSGPVSTLRCPTSVRRKPDAFSITTEVFTRSGGIRARTAPELCIYETSKTTEICDLTHSVLYAPGDMEIFNRLTSLGAIVISDLSCWDRQEDTLDPLADTVAESQSYPGLWKGVVVEQRASIKQLMDVVSELGSLNEGRGIRERIDILTLLVKDDGGLEQSGVFRVGHLGGPAGTRIDD